MFPCLTLSLKAQFLVPVSLSLPPSWKAQSALIGQLTQALAGTAHHVSAAICNHSRADCDFKVVF